jgi:hypothetical protein
LLPYVHGDERRLGQWIHACSGLMMLISDDQAA